MGEIQARESDTSRRTGILDKTAEAGVTFIANIPRHRVRANIAFELLNKEVIV
jgi:hypothetical protein